MIGLEILKKRVKEAPQTSGVYLFKKRSLRKIEKLKSTALERSEKLEQLRWLEAGISMEILIANKKSISIDTPEDLIEAERIIKIRKIKSLVLDVDGVLTDGTIWYGNNGEELKGFNSKDGLAIKLLLTRGIEVCLISARDSLPLKKRVKDLGLRNCVFGQSDKVLGCKQILNKLGIEKEYAAYIGDDNLDIDAMNYCGWSFAVSDAVGPVIECAKTVLSSNGGKGVIREVFDLVDNASDFSKVA